MTQLQITSKAFDNTRLSDFKDCPRQYFIRHVLGWRISGTADALVFGLAWHEGMDIVWKHAKQVDKRTLTELAFGAFTDMWEANGFPTDMSFGGYDRYGARTPGTAKEMYYNYADQRWKMLQEAEVVAIEQPFAVPMPGLEDTWYVGRLDKVVNWASNNLILEHKTTTAYAIQGNFRTDYVESWYAAPQIKGYQFAGNLFYKNVDAVWVDAALVHKKIHDAFKFIPIAHHVELLKEWIETTGRWISMVLEATHNYNSGTSVSKCFPKNENHCFGKFGQCPFLDICRSTPDPSKLDTVPFGYVEEKWEPFNILKLDQLVKTGEVNGQV